MTRTRNDYDVIFRNAHYFTQVFPDNHVLVRNNALYGRTHQFSIKRTCIHIQQHLLNKGAWNGKDHNITTLDSRIDIRKDVYASFIKSHRRKVPWIVVVLANVRRTLFVVHPPMAKTYILAHHFYHGSSKGTATYDGYFRICFRLNFH